MRPTRSVPEEMLVAQVVLGGPVGLQIRIADVDMTVAVGRRQLRGNVQFDELRCLKRRAGRETQRRTRIRSPDDARARIDAAAVTIEGGVIRGGRIMQM